ncbi:hypothetical protein ACRE_016740 [Hapsidospora chrysogenum ATCC 11550]|uniref:Uncharacterized protein n=1 Tax=Hapsidospora chrysogenum (strain ATCC 11550 / CBS 779.69 / DSM 880 / IAM 14645 / JCM 23072 / IMI 49137) TaxID=857340 RepID=A0A086TDQ7_HAPC1|nr:hypothetical protein ACRE_016740 [Hapsidospora chrysogenum ATCC 11550]
MERQLPDGSWDRFHSFNGSIRRPNAPSRLSLGSPRSERVNAVNALGDITARQSFLPRTAPLEGRGPPDPRLLALSSRSTSSTTASELLPERPPTDRSRVSTRSSYESFRCRDRSGSSDTVRGVTPTPGELATIDSLSTQTSDGGEERVPLRRNSPFTQAGRTYGSISGGRTPLMSPSVMMGGTTRRRVLSSTMQGVMLAIQGTVTLAVFSALIGVTVWQKEDSNSEFWSWLWTVGQPLLAADALLCFAALVAHELRGGLSAVVVLYVQAGILLLTTCTALALMARSVQHDSRAVKGAVMGCDAMLWGVSFLGFVRAVAVWRAEYGREVDDDEEEQLYHELAVPWKQ